MLLTGLFLPLIVALIVACIIIFLIFYFSGIPEVGTLFTANWAMFFFHLIVAVIMFATASSDGWDVFYEADYIPEGNVTGSTTREKLDEIRRRTYDKKKKKRMIAKLFNLCGIFSALTAFAHLFVLSVPELYTGWMTQKIGGQNPLRWLEYFVTSGIMMTCIASVADVKDEYSLLSVFVFTAVTNLFGMAIESSEGNAYKWFYMAAGFIPFIIPWYFIVKNFSLYSSTITDFESLFETQDTITIPARSEDEEDRTLTKKEFQENMENLDLIKILLTVILVLYCIFPAIQIAQIAYPNKYRLGELLFILSSFGSKVTLNSFVYFLGKRPSDTADYQESVVPEPVKLQVPANYGTTATIE
jgi:hypothetical protein